MNEKMEIRKTLIPKNKKGEPLEGIREREYIFFKVKFNIKIMKTELAMWFRRFI